MRLLDRILVEGFAPLDPELDCPKILGHLNSAQLVVIDNVAEYHFEHLSKLVKADRVMSLGSYPNIMLPFEVAFFEMRAPSNPSLAPPVDFGQCGFLVRMFKRGSAPLQFGELTGDSNALQRAQRLFLHEDAAYYMDFRFFFREKQTRKIYYFAGLSLPVSAGGRIVAPDETFPFVGKAYGLPSGVNQEDILYYVGATYLLPCLLALSFMHCRNVRMVEEMPPEKLSKSHQKKHRRPLLRYHMLQIDHAKEMLQREGKVSSLGLKQALHICRGHFKRFGSDGRGLLFGKHAATVWVPMHARGSVEEGFVAKDYSVK